MTGNRDRYGEALEDIAPVTNVPPVTGMDGKTYAPKPDVIRAHCAELRRVLAEARARREVQP